MAQLQTLPASSQFPKLRSVNTASDFILNLQDLIRYLSKRPTDAAAWNEVSRHLRIYTPKRQNYGFISPLICSLSNLLPMVAKQDYGLAAEKAKLLHEYAQGFEKEMPEAKPFIRDIASKRERIDTLHAKMDEAWVLYQSCCYPELESGVIQDRGVPSRAITLGQLSDGVQVVQIYLENHQFVFAAAAFEHLRLAFAHYSMSVSSAPQRELHPVSASHIYLDLPNEMCVRFPLQPILTDDKFHLFLNTLGTLVKTSVSLPYDLDSNSDPVCVESNLPHVLSAALFFNPSNQN